MSHIIKLKTKIMDRELFAETAKRMGCAVRASGEARFFEGRRVGMTVNLPGWKYPVVVEENGDLSYDNYRGLWGDIAALNGLVREYMKEMTLRQARVNGMSAAVEEREDGTLVIRISSE